MIAELSPIGPPIRQLAAPFIISAGLGALIGLVRPVGSTAPLRFDGKRTLLLHDRQRRLERRVGIDRDAVDALLDEEFRELGVAARGLAADADLAPALAAGCG